MQYIPDRLKAHVQVCDKAKKLFPDIDVEIKSSSSSSSQPFFPPSSTSQDLSPASPEGQPPLKKPFLLQARLPVSSTDRQLQEAVDLQVVLVFATLAACRAPYPPNLMFFNSLGLPFPCCHQLSIFAGGKRRVYQTYQPPPPWVQSG